MEVSLQDILNAREARVRKQQTLLSEHRAPLLCFTMNIAGPVKTSALIERGFRTGLALLDSQFPKEIIHHREVCVLATGCEAVYAPAMPPEEIKDLCMSIEENHPLGRLFDMDVLDVGGRKLERKTQRGCIVCGAPGRGCAASRAHSVDQLQAVTTKILKEYFCDEDARNVANLAVKSLFDEVRTTPKPGLVDMRNNGSHRDMDVALFEASAHALQPYFFKCVQIGQSTQHLSAEELFQQLRTAGQAAEKDMYRATGGINTHKGAIYTLGILCGSIGRLWTAENPIAGCNAILSQCSQIVRTSVEADFAAAEGKTAGERLYLQYGLRGIRGEVADGLPSVENIALPRFRQAIANGFSKNDAGVYALLHLIANVKDTNLYHRGGETGAKWAAQTAQALLAGAPSIAEIEALDDLFISRNLSPGGCADLLAVTYFLIDLMG